jgi:hypothetical protein
VRDAKVHAARWKNDYNHRRPHSSLGYVPPAVFAAGGGLGGGAPPRGGGAAGRARAPPPPRDHTIFAKRDGKVAFKTNGEGRIVSVA